MLGVKVGLKLRTGITPLDRSRIFVSSQVGSRHVQSAPPGNPAVVADFTLTNATSSGATLGNVPAVTITAPTGTIVPSCSVAPCVYQAAFLGVPNVSGWEVLGQATLSGGTLTFSPTNVTPIMLVPGTQYDLVLYATSATLSLSLTSGGGPIPNDTITFSSPFTAPKKGVFVSGGVPPYTAGTPSQSDMEVIVDGIVALTQGSTPGEFEIQPLAAGVATVPFKDSAGGAAALTVNVKCGPAPAGYEGGACHLYVADYSGSKILLFPIPILCAVTCNGVIYNPPSSSTTVAPSGANVVAVSVDTAGDVFYVADNAAFSTVYVGKCTLPAPNLVGNCSQIAKIPGAGASIAASGIAINAAGTSGFVVYSTASSSAGPANGIIAPLQVSGSTGTLGTPLSTISQTGAPVLPGYPIGSPYAGASLDKNNDLAVALPQGLGSSEPPGLVVFSGGALPASYYSFAGFGNVAPISPAWVWGSTTMLYGMYVQLNSMGSSTLGICTIPGGTCVTPSGPGFRPFVTNGVGLAIDSVGFQYLSGLGMLGSPNPLPPIFGSQQIYASPPIGSVYSGAVIQNNSSGQPFEAPWGLALGP
jgi:hypothetical protein